MVKPMLSAKQKELFNILLRQQQKCTVEQYASMLNVSKRTVYSYLDLLEPELTQRGYQLIRSPGQGVEVIKGKSINDETDEETDLFSIENRRMEMIYRILLKQEQVPFQTFCDEFYVSESSIRKDIVYLNQMLGNPEHLRFNISHKEIIVSGEVNERTTCEALIRLNEGFLIGNDWQSKLIHLASLYDIKIIETVMSLVTDYIHDVKINLAEHYMVNIASVLIVLTSMAAEGRHIQDVDNLLDYDRIRFLPNQILAKQFLGTLADQLSLTFSEGDSQFLVEYLVADRIQIHNFEKIVDADRVIFEKILKKMEMLIYVDFSSNEDYRNNLLLHLNAMAFRLRKGLKLKNDLLRQIKKEFEMLFNLTWVVLESEADALHIRISEDEVGFLVIHFQNFIDQQQRTKRILLICPQGIATSEMILNRLRMVLPAFNAIETASTSKAYRCNLDSIDFVVSTVDVEDIHKPVVRVSPVITDEDLRNIMSFYQQQILQPSRHERKELKLLTLMQYIKSDFIIEGDAENKEEIILNMAAKLQMAGYVNEGYGQTMLNRETNGSTDNIYQIALPHGDIKLVNKTIISFYLLKTAKKWKNHVVKLVIFFNIAENDLTISKKILDDLYSFIKSQKLAEILKQNCDKRSIEELLGIGEIYD